MKKFNTGDLVWLPSEVILYQKNSQSIVESHKRTTKPANVLITSVNYKTYEVYYDSEYWLVDKESVY